MSDSPRWVQAHFALRWRLQHNAVWAWSSFKWCRGTARLLVQSADRPVAAAAAVPAGFPPGPPGDQSLALLSDPLAFISRLRREYGPLVGLLLGGERVVLVADPDAACAHRVQV
jgi:hypothetical protein